MLDLRYEARDIEQHLTSPAKVDKWFDAKTKGMTDLSRAELKKRWGTMQKVVSSEPRAKQIVTDILLDMATKPRLMDGRGNAMLVSSSINQACTFYRLFCQAGFQGKCAIVTSYAPEPGDISKEDSGQGMTEKLLRYETYRQMLADHFNEPADTAMRKVEKFEQDVKEQFIEQPGQMRLLIVVDKLLTGFDAPPATYLYIDKTMRDHGLFQAICRVNRLDGDDKDYGYIVDYRDLFNSLESAITDYTTGALDGYEKQDIEGLLSDRLEKAREDLDEALEKIRAICERVEPPKNTLQYQQYFCAAEPGNARAAEGQRTEASRAVQGRRGSDTRRTATSPTRWTPPATAQPKRQPSRRRLPTTRVSAMRSSSARVRMSTSSNTKRTCDSCSTPTSRLTRRRRSPTSETLAWCSSSSNWARVPSASCRRGSGQTRMPLPRPSPTTSARSSSTTTR